MAVKELVKPIILQRADPGYISIQMDIIIFQLQCQV
mgnify:CR=1 FL=1